MSAPITEAHYDLRRQVIFSDADEGAELIADSEARAGERLRREIDWLQLNNDMLTDNPVGHARAVAERQAIIDERDELRGALALGQQNRDDAYDDLRSERDAARAEVKRLKELHQLDEAMIVQRTEALNYETEATKAFCDDRNAQRARAERAEAELGKLQELHGCSQGMVVHWCEHAAKRSLELDFQVARNSDLFTQRDEAVEAQGKAEAELATERARLDWLGANGYLLDEMTHGAGKAHPADFWICTNGDCSGRGATPRAAIDAAMKEGA